MAGTLVKGSPSLRAATAIVHLLSSAAAGVLFGAAVGWFGSIVDLGDAAALLVLGLVALAYGAMDLGLVQLPLPQTGKQVPSMWRYRFHPVVTSALYGFLLGPGVGTRVAYAGYTAVLAAAALGGPAVGAVVMGTYASVRATAALVTANTRGQDPTAKVLVGFQLKPLWQFLSIETTFLILGGAIGVAAVV
jgi:hypothetical protein